MTCWTRSVLLLVIVLILAGCGGGQPETASTAETVSPTEPPTGPTDTAETPSERVHVYGGELPVNATRAWLRVEALHGDEFPKPTVVVKSGESSWEPDPFAQQLGVSPTLRPPPDRAGGVVRPGSRKVRLFPRSASADRTEAVLVHEYAHVVQGSLGLFNRLFAGESGSRANRVVYEGAATYLADSYSRRYLGYSELNRICTAYTNGTAYERYHDAPYCVGGQYYRDRFASSNALPTAYRNPPNTTEQIVHGLDPGAEPPTNLTVSIETGASTWYEPGSPDRQGELFIRTVLRVALDDEAAADAAAGWGNDRLVRLASGEKRGYIWVLHWDTPPDAGEFKSTFERYLDAQGEHSGDRWRVNGSSFAVSRPGNRTVVVTAGEEAFLDGTTIVGSEGNISVTVR